MKEYKIEFNLYIKISIKMSFYNKFSKFIFVLFTFFDFIQCATMSYWDNNNNEHTVVLPCGCSQISQYSTASIYLFYAQPIMEIFQSYDCTSYPIVRVDTSTTNDNLRLFGSGPSSYWHNANSIYVSC